MEEAERLGRLSVNDAVLLSSTESEQEPAVYTKHLCLARLGALVASSAPGPSVRSEVHAAMGAGATSTDVLNTLAANLPVAGRPRTVAAAPKIALALGYDLDLLGSEG